METPDIAHLTEVISHATAPAFLLGAVAGFLSILMSRLERLIDRVRAAAREDDGSIKVPSLISRRIVLLNHAIYLAVLSALSTAALLIVAFVSAFFSIQHERGVGALFILALILLMASLVQLAREVRLARAAFLADGIGY
jgi:Protein of unknown function (DUF2721)